MYDYKFVEIPIKKLFTSKKTTSKTMNDIKSTITEHAKHGWRFVQVFTQIGEGLITPDHYEVIFEKEVKNN